MSKALCQEPFKPVGGTSVRSLTKGTLFLISRATAKRIGEVQSLSAKVAFRERDVGDTFLQYPLEFRAKTDNAPKPCPGNTPSYSLRKSEEGGRGEMPMMSKNIKILLE